MTQRIPRHTWSCSLRSLRYPVSKSFSLVYFIVGFPVIRPNNLSHTQERLLSMRLDREDNVAVHAIHVCGHLLSLDMLEPEDCVQVCELVFVENRAVSHAAGAFAVRYLFSEDFMARAKQAKVPKGESSHVSSNVLGA